MRLYTTDEAELYRYYKIELNQFRYVCPSCKWFVEFSYGYNCGNKVTLSGKWHAYKLKSIDAYMYYCRSWNRNELLP